MLRHWHKFVRHNKSNHRILAWVGCSSGTVLLHITPTAGPPPPLHLANELALNHDDADWLARNEHPAGGGGGGLGPNADARAAKDAIATKASMSGCVISGTAAIKCFF